MFANLGTQSMYTVAVTAEPIGTAQDEVFYDEVDVIASSRATVAQVIAAADLDGYEHCRVVGVIDQSSGYVYAEAWDGDLRSGGAA